MAKKRADSEYVASNEDYQEGSQESVEIPSVDWEKYEKKSTGSKTSGKRIRDK